MPHHWFEENGRPLRPLLHRPIGPIGPIGPSRTNRFPISATTWCYGGIQGHPLPKYYPHGAIDSSFSTSPDAFGVSCPKNHDWACRNHLCQAHQSQKWPWMFANEHTQFRCLEVINLRIGRPICSVSSWVWVCNLLCDRSILCEPRSVSMGRPAHYICGGSLILKNAWWERRNVLFKPWATLEAIRNQKNMNPPPE